MSSFRRILGYLRPYALLGVLIFVLSILFAALDVYTNVFIEDFVDEALLQANVTLLIIITLQYVLVSTGREVAEYLVDICTGRLTGYFITDVRKDFYNKITKLPYSYFVTHDKSEIISRFVNDGERTKELLEQIFHSIYHAATTALFIAVMFYKNFHLTLSFLLVVPGMLIIIKLFARKIIFTGKRIQEQLVIFVNTLKDFLGGIRVIKAFGTEEFEREKFRRNSEDYFNRHYDNVKVRASFEFIEGWVMFLSLAAIAVYGGYEVIKGNMHPGRFMFFFVALGEVHENISDFIEILGKIQTYFYASERLFKILDIEVEEKDVNSLVPLSQMQGDVDFKDVSFRYPGSEAFAINNLSFSIKKGEVIAIIGRSGSGKSTVANLLLNLYDPTNGKIKIDGKDITKLKDSDLHNQISIVPQETFLFSDTIANNISYGSSNYSIEDVRRVAERAFVTEFTDKMRDGMNAMVREDGSNLSGGQKQRIAIARAILRNPKILILDEATSALDAESGKLVSEAIENSMSGRTTIFITHKISSAAKADRILVMHNGELIEQGTHDQLIELDGIYSSLSKQQLLQD
ncbi:MAG TPA: hypothetical protein DEP20_00050 [Fusobacteria bacterium]|nr:hypothetical protein [Fusobacteriota bacterium]